MTTHIEKRTEGRRVLNWCVFDDDPTEREIFTELSNPLMTDRAIAIMAAAFLEYRLEEAIKKKLTDRKTKRKKDDRTLFTRLFGAESPLGTFSSKIDIGLALKIFGNNSWKDFHAIRDIRNAFAHRKEPTSFNTQDIRDWCNNLIMGQTITFGEGPLPIDTRERFLATVDILNWRISSEPVQAGRVDTEEWDG